MTTGVVAALGITELLLARRTGKLALVLHVATITVSAVDLVFCLVRDDIRQLGYLAAIVVVLAVFAAVRKVVDAVPAAGVASFGAQFAIVLFAMDEYIALWAARSVSPSSERPASPSPAGTAASRWSAR